MATSVQIETLIKQRLAKRLNAIPFFLDLGLSEFYVAGNSLNRSSPKDIDLFPVKRGDFKDLPKANRYTICKTRNAHTINLHGKIIQLCNYHHGSLAALIESFDFAHIKIGALIIASAGGIQVREVKFSEDWTVARSVQSTFYTGSNYPLSSMVRCFKYFKRGEHAGQAYMNDVFKIVTDVAKRGFHDYEDFKDQLDAVDLGLLPSDLYELNNSSLMELFEVLKK